PTVAYRVLHAFPTRRSSDLIADDQVAAFARDGQVPWDLSLRGTAASDEEIVKAIGSHPFESVELRETRVSDAGLKALSTCPNLQDRKSTRLNSSHLGISYAV